MYDAPVGLPYSETPTRNQWLAAILALLGGLVVTALIGIAGYFYIASRLPATILLVMAVEAILTGFVLGWLYRVTKVRGIAGSVTIAAICGLLGSAYCHYGFYVRTALDYHDLKVARKVAADDDAIRKALPLMHITPGSKEFEHAVAELQAARPKGESDPRLDFDQTALYPKTGYHGFSGYMVWFGVSGVTMMLLYVGAVIFIAVQLGWAEPRIRGSAVAD